MLRKLILRLRAVPTAGCWNQDLPEISTTSGYQVAINSKAVLRWVAEWRCATAGSPGTEVTLPPLLALTLPKHSAVHRLPAVPHQPEVPPLGGLITLVCRVELKVPAFGKLQLICYRRVASLPEVSPRAAQICAL